MSQPESAPVLDRIASAFTAAGLTAEEFAHVTGRDPARLTGILAGTRSASSLDLALIAETTGTTVDWLLHDTPAPVIIACTTD